MSGGQEVDAKLASRLQARLFELAGEKQVVAVSGRFQQARAAAAGDDGDPFDHVRAVKEGQRLAPELLGHPCDQFLRTNRRR